MKILRGDSFEEYEDNVIQLQEKPGLLGGEAGIVSRIVIGFTSKHLIESLNFYTTTPFHIQSIEFRSSTKKSQMIEINTETQYVPNAAGMVKIFAPGRTYRCDSDITHTPMFHQVEGLVVDYSVTFANLKWFLEKFCKTFFDNEKLKLRFRPSYFPFTEPSAEVDILSDEKKWVEILGCGIINPVVLENCNIDSDKYSGFAFGLGVERIAMIKYGISDIRDFYKSNLDFLDQFK